MQESFSAEEIRIIQQYAQQIEDNEQLPIKASEAIKAELNINRTPQQIKNFLYTLDRKEQHQNSKIAGQKSQGSLNLFKTFQQPRSIQQVTPSLARPVPRRKPQMTYSSSKRKIVKREQAQNRSSWTLQQRLNQIQQINEQCTYTFDKLDRKINRKQSIKQQNGGISNEILWFYNEYFYSNYDRKYFQVSQMKEVYQCLGVRFGEIKYREHKDVLRALGTPQLFNDEFIAEQKNKLEQYRNSCRINTKNLSKSNQNSTEFPVHSIVLALHPLCGHLHIGSIMAYYKQNLYMVRFLKPQLPAHKILDTSMSTQFTSISNKQKSLQLQSQKILSHSSQIPNTQGVSDIQSQIIQNVNFQVTGYLIKLLEYKAQLVKFIRFINDRIDKKQNVAPQGSDNGMKRVLGWVIGVVGMVDGVLREGLVRFRLRGVNQSNTSSIFNNLKELLINPLKIMSKEFQNSNEQPDINAAQQIKQIISKQRDNQIRKAINNAIMISNNSNNQNNQSQTHKQQNKKQGNISPQNIDKKNTQNMMPLLYSCLGILADLRYEGKQFDVENNVNLLKFGDLTGKENSQSFNEVYEKLYSIVNKVRE